MKPAHLATLLVVTVALSGCANTIHMYRAQKYFDAGAAAERSGNYRLAHENYQRAYENTEAADTDAPRKGLTMYNLGRMKGHLCMKKEAESLLRDSLAIEETALSEDGVWYTGRLVEMGRFYFGFGDSEKAVSYFAKASRRLVESGAEQKYPVDMADFWDNYADALRRSGFDGEAEEMATRAQSLRDSNAGKIAPFDPLPYGENCKSGG